MPGQARVARRPVIMDRPCTTASAVVHGDQRRWVRKRSFTQFSRRPSRKYLAAVRAAIERTMPLELPHARGIRHALVLRPLGPCPQTYPRAVGMPAKHPLGGSSG